MDAGYLYARNVQNRMLIGGGRHLGLEREEELVKALTSVLNTLFPETDGTPFEYKWTGLLGVGTTRNPIVKSVRPGCVIAVRMGGMGVAIGMQLGQECINLLLAE